MNTLLSPLAALGSGALLGVADFGGGVAGRRTSVPSVIAGMELAGLVALPLAIVLLPLHWDLRDMGLAFSGGVVGGLGLIAFYRAMTISLIAAVAPITGVIAAALPVALGILGGDRLHVGQLVGIAVGLLSIALINGAGRSSAPGARAGLWLAVLAGAAFGFFFIVVHAGSPAGTAAFLSTRLGSEAAVLVAALVIRASPIPQRGSWLLVAAVGAFDGAGNVLYLYASQQGLLALTSVLASFYPAFTVLCARLIAHEKQSRTQTAGAVLAVAAVALIAGA
ncbi:MAG: DMT family transporter [Candidatus Dormibacteraeota bacterium]|nr:DMT family transporter [Candidatus Dormibacteraeota bacterium]